MSNPRRTETAEAPEAGEPAEAVTPAAEPTEPARDATGRFASPDPLADPRVIAAMEARVKEASAAAAKAAKAEAEESAKIAAERSQMDELTRVKAELEDSQKAAALAGEQARAAQDNADFSLALVGAGVQLAGSEAAELIRYAASKRRAADPELTMDAAVKAALEANPYLVAVQATQLAGQVEEAPAPKLTLHTAPDAKTPAPTAPKRATPPVDVLELSESDYQAYKRAQYGTN